MNNCDTAIQHIKDNLYNQENWTHDDYVEFYDRDVSFLLSLTSSLKFKEIDLDGNYEIKCGPHLILHKGQFHVIDISEDNVEDTLKAHKDGLVQRIWYFVNADDFK